MMQFKLEKESELTKKEWDIKREREKAEILLRPSPVGSPARSTPDEVKGLKATTLSPLIIIQFFLLQSVIIL